MATWQEGNGAGFLAGIGRQNDNAPQAGDNGLTLGIIRQNNDIQRSGANNVGLQALQGAAGLVDTMRQADFAKATQQFNQAHANAWATGDNSGLVKFAQENPAFVAQAQQAVSGLDAQQKQELGSLAMQTNTALAQGPQAYSQFINANSDRLKRVGADPGWMLQTGISSPEQLSHLTTTMALGAVGPEKALSMQQTGQIANASLGYKYDALKQQATYQQGTLAQGQQQLNLTAQKNQADNANKQLELSLRAGENNSRSQATQQAAVQKMQDYVGAHQSSVNNVSSMYDTVNQVKAISPEVFDRVFGFGGTVNSRIPGTESADAWSKIEQMQGQARLMGVIGMKGTGPVSDSEGQAAARAFLAINQNMSPKAARAAIDNWQKVLQRQTAYLQKQQPMVDTYQRKIDTFNAGLNSTATMPQAGQSEGGYTFLGGDPGNPNSWRKN